MRVRKLILQALREEVTKGLGVTDIPIRLDRMGYTVSSHGVRNHLKAMEAEGLTRRERHRTLRRDLWFNVRAEAEWNGDHGERCGFWTPGRPCDCAWSLDSSS